MRWDALFAEVEAGSEADAEAARRSEIADRVRAELGRLRLIDRLQPLLGRAASIRLGLPAGDAVSGSVAALGANWVLLAQRPGEAEWLVPLAAVQWIEGLSEASAEPGWEGAVGARLDLRFALRRLVRDRSAVALTLLGGQVRHGRPERVGADHLVLAATGPDRQDQAPIAIPLGAIACLRRG